VAKVNAAERLRESFARPGYSRCCSTSARSPTPTSRPSASCASPAAVIEVLAEHRHAFSLITKSTLIERDLDLIAPMARDRLAAVYLSITTLDARLARVMEPRAAAPRRRLQTIERLAAPGCRWG
jgi:DNA repair photolyase